MENNRIDAKLFARAFLAAAKRLDEKKDWINELNVFPVPDGDTGTNMTMTIMSAVREVVALENPDMAALGKAISSGSLRGARGNSGVILSQLLRGLTREIGSAAEVDVTLLAAAFNRAADTAYKAVMKPKEGTILTVARGMADRSAELAMKTDDMMEFLEGVVAYGDEVLANTPQMLPVLKQAGVVDSGGQGLMEVMRGALMVLMGQDVELDNVVMTQSSAQASAAASDDIDTADIKFGYCTEFIINISGKYTEDDELAFKAYLEGIGDCVVVVSDTDIVKVHVHTNDPGLAIQKALTMGSLSRMKIDNMREEHRELLIQNADAVAAVQKTKEKKTEPPTERKPYGFIAVAAGSGMSEIFKGIGADVVIEGGQTMNPSTEDILNAVETIAADTVFVLPNNKNIIMAAKQAADLTEDKNVLVVPSKTMPQGITALVNFIPELSPDDNFSAMQEEMGNVASGQVTYAVRDTMIDGREIKEGDIMGIGDRGLEAVEKDVKAAVLATLKAMVTEDSELISIYAGADTAKEDAEAVRAAAEEMFPDCEVELHNGGQPVYYYMMSVE